MHEWNAVETTAAQATTLQPLPRTGRGCAPLRRADEGPLKTNPPREDHVSPPLARDRARELRHTSTDAEYRLWSRLRNRGLKVKFRRQHPIGPHYCGFLLS